MISSLVNQLFIMMEVDVVKSNWEIIEDLSGSGKKSGKWEKCEFTKLLNISWYIHMPVGGSGLHFNIKN